MGRETLQGIVDAGADATTSRSARQLDADGGTYHSGFRSRSSATGETYETDNGIRWRESHPMSAEAFGSATCWWSSYGAGIAPGDRRVLHDR